MDVKLAALEAFSKSVFVPFAGLPKYERPFFELLDDERNRTVGIVKGRQFGGSHLMRAMEMFDIPGVMAAKDEAIRTTGMHHRPTFSEQREAVQRALNEARAELFKAMAEACFTPEERRLLADSPTAAETFIGVDLARGDDETHWYMTGLAPELETFEVDGEVNWDAVRAAEWTATPYTETVTVTP